jgi:hypothetical protein
MRISERNRAGLSHREVAGGCVSLVAMAIFVVGARAEDGERQGGEFTVLPHRRMNPPHGPVDIG